ncbi:MAG: transcription repressor NadR [Anaerotardibacter sp.]
MANSPRQKEIIRTLRESKTPLSGTALGEMLGVSRQVIVQDIALLRTSGYDIISTNRGYLLNTSSDKPCRLVKVQHGPDQIEEELNLIVDLGGCVEDVLVNHRTYAKLEAPLKIKNRRDVRNFIEDLKKGVSSPLSVITSGYHFHHITAESEEVLDEIVDALEQNGFLAEFTSFEKGEQ